MSERLCQACGAANRPESLFCGSCGARLSPVEPAQPEHAPTRDIPASGLSIGRGHTVDSLDVPVLILRWPGGKTEEHPLIKRVIQIGRGPHNDIVLNFPTVSGNHLRLEVTRGEVHIVDLGSTNGTQLAGIKIPPHQPQRWLPGDTVRVGDLQGNSVSMDLQSGIEAVSQVRDLGVQELAQHARVLIGRDPASQLRLDHATVSYHHAEIVRHDGVFVIQDLESRNGTFVNGQRITGRTALRTDDVIQIGPYQLVYNSQIQGLSRKISRGYDLDAVSLGMEVAPDRMILEDISLAVQAGEFVSLVGGSGAGKSTLLKAMNGFNPATHGEMRIDGRDLYEHLDAYRTQMGYVPQDDIIHRDLPVDLALRYAAKLRLPDASDREIEARIKGVLQMVDLTAHAKKQVKVLSGGQRKRVSIAAELLAEPALLFLDEPTSGLDPGLEKKMMADLNRLADQGKTIVLVTHATANIDQCHHVAFLVRGRLAYYGPPNEAISFFEAQDFADIYLKLSQEVDPAAGKPAPDVLAAYYPAVRARLNVSSMPAGLLWAEHYARSELCERYVNRRRSRGASYGPSAPGTSRGRRRRGGGSLLRSVADWARRLVGRDSPLRQLWILARRQFDLIRYDWITLFVLLLMMPFIAGLFMVVSNEDDLVGWQFSEERVERDLKRELWDAEVDEKAEYMPAPTAELLVTMLGLALTQAGTFGAAFEIVKERSIFARERAVNLKIPAYVGSKVFVLGVFALIQVASSLLILSIKLDMDFEPILDFFPSGALELGVTLFIAVMASIMMGLFISAVVPNQNIVLYVILGQLFVQIILSGALFPLPDSGVTKTVSQMVVSHWTMDAMGSTVDIVKLNDESRICRVIENQDPRKDVDTEIVCDSAAQPEEDLGLDYEHDADHLKKTWLALALQAVVWCGATMVVQTLKKPE